MIPVVLNLTATAGEESLTFTWEVSSTEGLKGFDAVIGGVRHPLVPTARALTVRPLKPGAPVTYSVAPVIETTGAAKEGEATPLPANEPAGLTLKLTADGTGVEAPTAPAGTAKLHVAYCSTAQGGTPQFTDVAWPLAAPIVPPSTHPFVDAVPRNTANVDLASWWSATHPRVETRPAAKPPEEEHKPPVGSCLPGVCFNGGSTPQIAQAIGSKVIRIEGSVQSLASTALAGGQLAVPIVGLGPPPIGEVKALDPTHRAALFALEFGNENWPGGIGQQVSGRAYGEAFVKAAAEAKGVVPLLCQVNLTPTNVSWTVDVFNTPGIKQALEGNMLASHPYGSAPMRPCAEPSNLIGKSHGWEFQRIMQEQYYVQQQTGLAVPICATEVGWQLSRHSQAEVGTLVEELFQFLTLVKKGKVPAAWLPHPGYTPNIPFITYYSLMGNPPGGSNTFGLEFYGGQHNEPARQKFHDGAAALLEA